MTTTATVTVTTTALATASAPVTRNESTPVNLHDERERLADASADMSIGASAGTSTGTTFSPVPFVLLLAGFSHAAVTVSWAVMSMGQLGQRSFGLAYGAGVIVFVAGLIVSLTHARVGAR